MHFASCVAWIISSPRGSTQRARADSDLFHRRERFCKYPKRTTNFDRVIDTARSDVSQSRQIIKLADLSLVRIFDKPIRIGVIHEIRNVEFAVPVAFQSLEFGPAISVISRAN